MAISYVNTTEVAGLAEEIISLTNELDKEFNSLFTRFAEVPFVTGEWVGNQSQFYFNKISNDKKQYIKFVEGLRDVAYKLNADIYMIENCIKKCNNENN